MKINGEVSEDEVVESIGDKWLLNTMKGITEDEVYSMEEKYLIIEGMLSQWGKEPKRNPPT